MLCIPILDQSNYKEEVNKMTSGNKYKRGPVLILVMSFYMVVGFVKIIINITLPYSRVAQMATSFINNRVLFIPFPLPYPIRHILEIAAISVGIILLYMCMVKLKKQAFTIYAVLTAVEAVMQLLDAFFYIIKYQSYNIGPPATVIYSRMFPFVVRGVLLLIVYVLDVKHFDTEKQED